MKKTWKTLAEMTAAVMAFGLVLGLAVAQTSNDIYPVGPHMTTGIQTRATTPYSGGASGIYVPLAGGTGVGERMTGRLRVGCLDTPIATNDAMAIWHSGTSDGSGVDAGVVIYDDMLMHANLTPVYGLAVVRNFTARQASSRGGAIAGYSYGSAHLAGLTGGSDTGPSGLFMALGSANTSPSLVSRLAAGQSTAAHLWRGQDASGATVAYIDGTGTVSGVAGGFSSAVYTPSLLSGIANENMAIAGAGTGKILLNDTVVLQNTGPLTFTPAAAVVIDDAADTLPVGAKTVILNPTDATGITLTGAPTIANGTDPEGSIIDFSLASGETGWVVVQDQALIAGSNLLLGANTRTIRYPGHLRLRFNGTDWEEDSFVSGITHLAGTATLDFGSTAAGTTTELTMTVTGAASGDMVTLGVPAAAVPASYGVFFGYVSAANTVTIRFANNALIAAADPASASFNVFVDKL